MTACDYQPVIYSNSEVYKDLALADSISINLTINSNDQKFNYPKFNVYVNLTSTKVQMSTFTLDRLREFSFQINF